MPDTIIPKILGQVAPLAATDTLLYEAPYQTRARITGFFTCNRGNAPATFRFAVVPGGGTPQNHNYLFYDRLLNGVTAGDNSYSSDIQLYLNSGDQVMVYASTAGFSFTVFGNET